MTLGSVIADSSEKILTVGKDGSNPIALGALCIRDSAPTPKGYKQCPATTLQVGPFVVCVNRAAAAADRAFSGAFPGTSVVMKAQGAITVGAEVQNSATVSGAVMAFVGSSVATPTAAEVLAVQADRLRVVGRYIGHEDEMTGAKTATDAADAETNIVIRLGGGAA